MSVLAGTVVFAGAAFVATTGASADTQKVPKGFDAYKPAGANAQGRVAKSDSARKLPHERRTTVTEYKLGKSGPAFEAPPQVKPRIVGGTEASVANHPYVVALVTLFWKLEGGQFVPYESICSGTVLSSTKVLTVGHCSYDSPLGTTYVIAGRNNISTNNAGFVTTARATFTNPAFVAPGNIPTNDVAVLTLTDALPSAYTPIALVGQGDESSYADGTQATIVGYGITSGGAEDSGVLREANIPIRNDSACTNLPGDFPNYVNSAMVCAGTPRTSGNAGVDSCGGDSGGPLYVVKGGVKTVVGTVGWGPTDCGKSYGVYTQLSTYSNLIKADVNRKVANNLDWTGDGHSDLIARDGAGNLLLYSGSGLVTASHPGAFSGDAAWIGEGWGVFKKIFRTYNWNGDNRPAIFAVAQNGDMYQFRGDGEGDFVTATGELIGTGWNFADIMVTNNWIDGVNRPNLMGRTAKGDLFLYTSNGAGGWENGGQGIPIGNGWNMFNTVLTPGDWLGDGRQALIGRTPAGQLRLYQSNGAGGWVNGTGVAIGSGWNMFNIFMSPGDFNGDNLVDMIGITPGGEMRLYMTDGKGNWLNGQGLVIGSGWNGFNAVL